MEQSATALSIAGIAGIAANETSRTNEGPRIPDTLELVETNHPAAGVLLRRKIRRSLLEWCRFLEAKKGQTPAAHHLFIIDVLQKITDGVLKKVILLMPPGAAKSTYASVDFPPFYLANHPTHLLLACSYSYTLVEGFGRQCRDLIEAYQNELGYGLSTTAAASGDWRITPGNGGYFCAGVGSGIAGHRADLGVIDDYLGSEEDADSATIRQKQYKWYHNDFWPRLKPNAAQLIIANRRHEEDLVGLLTKEDPSWTVISLPYFAEANDPLGRPCGVKWNEEKQTMVYDLESRLWPEWFTVEHAMSVLKKDARTRAGLYQQRPAPEEGNFFKRNMFMPYTMEDLRALEASQDYRCYVGSDYALRKGQENDPSCFLPGLVDTSDNLWILPDWFWERVNTLEACQRMISIARKRKPILWWAGRENITGAIEPFLQKMMFEENCYISIEELSEAKDKQAKAQSIKARMSQGKVLFPTFHPQWPQAMEELLNFPGGAHDDFVDALAKLGQGLSKMVSATKTKPSWDGVVPEQRLTCRWVERSHRQRERVSKLALLDH